MSEEHKDSEEFENLGYANGWNGEEPHILKECRRKNHELKSYQVRRDVIEVQCNECRFFYRVDSSG